MGNEHVGQVLFFLQFLQQVDDLGLNGHVQSGDALVAHDELGLHRQRAGNADTLPLAAGELVGITVQHIILQTAFLHRLNDVLPHGFGAVLVEVVGHQTFLDDLADGEAGVQAGIGILENDLQILAQRPLLLIFQPGQVNAVIPHGFILGKFGIVGILLPKSRQRSLHIGDLLILNGNLTVQRLDLFFQLFHAADVAALAVLQLYRQLQTTG